MKEKSTDNNENHCVMQTFFMVVGFFHSKIHNPALFNNLNLKTQTMSKQRP